MAASGRLGEAYASILMHLVARNIHGDKGSGGEQHAGGKDISKNSSHRDSPWLPPKTTRIEFASRVDC